MILLPPSEGKSEGGDPGTRWNPKSGTFPVLGTPRTKIVRALVDANGGSATLLGVGGKHLDRARAANTSLTSSPTCAAWKRYTGVVWDHLDIASLTARERTIALAAIVVPSALAGVVAAGDPLPDYRLKIGASLAPLGKMATWWRDAVTAAFATHVGNRPVIDLLTNDHRSVFADRAGWREVTFVSKSGVAIGHDAKATKGLFARHLIAALADGATIDDALSSFRNGKLTVKVRTV